VTKCIYSLTDRASKLLFSKELVNAYRSCAKCFTRNRRMGFAKIMGVILNFSKKSLQLELDNFMELLDPAIEKPMTKQAFSKARLNIMNENLLIGSLKDNFIRILFEDDGLKRTILMQKLIDRVASHWVPVRPGRSFPRRPDSHKRIANRQRKAL
jgi:hypothetical protein